MDRIQTKTKKMSKIILDITIHISLFYIWLRKTTGLPINQTKEDKKENEQFETWWNNLQSPFNCFKHFNNKY
jgi:hypothetical protein